MGKLMRTNQKSGKKRKTENKTMGLRNSKELQDNKKDEEEEELHHRGRRQCGKQKETQNEETRGLDCLGEGKKEREREKMCKHQLWGHAVTGGAGNLGKFA